MVGRTTDFVVRPDGVIMHALAVIYVLRAVEGIAEFKLDAARAARCRVLLVPDGRWTDACHAQVMAGLAARLGSEVRIRIRMVGDSRRASGKYRYVVSNVALPRGLDPALLTRPSPRKREPPGQITRISSR